MAINVSKLIDVLQEFVSKTNDVEGAVLVSPDGLALASSLPSNTTIDEERISAMSAAMLSLGERIGKELNRGEINQIYVEGNQGYGILTSCTDDAVLLVLANKQIKQGILMLEIKRTLGELQKIMS